jgi:heme-degrading monooxygenase HmoA
MAVQVLIRRRFVEGKEKELAPLIVKLRSLARMQPGYISGETLRCIEPAVEYEYLVRSTWQSLEAWKNWLHSKERKELQDKIDVISSEKTEYRIYESLVGGILPKEG